jgi:hypothetical protein
MSRITLDTPKVVTKVNTFTEFSIKDIRIELNNIARFIVILYGADNLVDVTEIAMTPEEYDLWGSDDNYVINFLKTKLQSS